MEEKIIPLSPNLIPEKSQPTENNDKLILESDIPERLFNLQNIDFTTKEGKEEIEEEHNWVFHHLFFDKENDPASQIILEKIDTLIQMFRSKQNDIPYIIHYKPDSY